MKPLHRSEGDHHAQRPVVLACPANGVEVGTDEQSRAFSCRALVPPSQVAYVVPAYCQARLAHPRCYMFVDSPHWVRSKRPGQLLRLLAARAEDIAALHNRRRIATHGQVASKVMSCAPSHRTSFPSAASCSAP